MPSVNLSWNPVSGATDYTLERSVNSNPFAQIAIVSGTTYSDGDIAPGQTLIYRLKARNSAGSSSGVTVSLSIPSAPGGEGGPPPPGSGKYVIAFLQPFNNSEVSDLVAQQSVIAAAPYDAVTAFGAQGNAPALHLMDGVVRTYSEIYSSLSGMAGYPKDWWLLVWTGKPGAWSNNSAWATAATSWANAAKAAKDLGAKGIVFDNEPYSPYTMDDMWGINNSDADKPLARQRGFEIMQAVLGQWPDVKMFVTNGPSNNDQVAKDAGRIHAYPPDWKMWAPFFFGMVDAIGSNSARLTDGNGDYRTLTDPEFADSYDLRKHGLSIIPADLASVYSTRVNVGFLIYNQNWPIEVTTTLSMWTQRLTRAEQYADSIWGVYIETPGQGYGSNPGNWVYPTSAEAPWIAAIPT